MEIVTANEAKTNFGSMLLKTQTQHIQINKNGKPVAVMISMEEYEKMETLKLHYLQQLVERAEDDIANHRLVEGEAFFAELYRGKF